MIQKEVVQENLAQKDITRKGGIPETEICGAIFDLDGVLLDSMAVWNDLGVRYLQKRGIQPEAGLSQILFSMSMGPYHCSTRQQTVYSRVLPMECRNTLSWNNVM